MVVILSMVRLPRSFGETGAEFFAFCCPLATINKKTRESIPSGQSPGMA
jgi:hypothetical protein